MLGFDAGPPVIGVMVIGGFGALVSMPGAVCVGLSLPLLWASTTSPLGSSSDAHAAHSNKAELASRVDSVEVDFTRRNFLGQRVAERALLERSRRR